MNEAKIKLPPPKIRGKISVEEAIAKRRTHRAYEKTPLTVQEVSQLLFASQGINNGKNRRTVPSAGALYPIEVYLASGNVKGVAPGIYKYHPEKHQLLRIAEGDKRKDLLAATSFQFWIEEAPAIIILCGTPWKTMIKYGWRGRSFILMEIGHAGQNISLQAIPLGMGTVCMGGFNKTRVRKILKLRGTETPLYILPVGKVAKNNQEKELEISERRRRAIKEFLSKKRPWTTSY